MGEIRPTAELTDIKNHLKMKSKQQTTRNKFIFKRNHNFIKKNPTYNQNIEYKRQSHKLIPPTVECYLYSSSTNLMLRGETKSHLLYENKISKLKIKEMCEVEQNIEIFLKKKILGVTYKTNI